MEYQVIEFIFAFVTAFFSLAIKIQAESGNLNKAYINAAVSLGADESFITKDVKWKTIQPLLFNHLFELHFYIWTTLLAFEFIKGGLGMGVVLSNALRFSDLSALFSAIIVIALTIFTGSQFLKYLKMKFFAWNGDR